MKIDLTELLREVGNVADLETKFENDKSLSEDGITLTQPVKIKLRLVNAGESILISGTAESEVLIECSRCLEKFRLPLRINIKETYSKHPLEHPGLQEIELKEEDFVYPIEKDNTIDLSDMIRQNILLALPIKALCKPDCKGG